VPAEDALSAGSVMSCYLVVFLPFIVCELLSPGKSIWFSIWHYKSIWRVTKMMTIIIFTALRLCSRSIAMSKMLVRPSVKCVNGVKNRRKFCPHFYTIWKIDHFSFPTRRMVGEGRPLLCEILGQTDPPASKTPIFNHLSHNTWWKKFSYH